MPGPLLLAHHLGDGAILLDEVVAGHARVGTAQQIDWSKKALQSERSRTYDALHYRIAIRLDLDQKFFEGDPQPPEIAMPAEWPEQLKKRVTGVGKSVLLGMMTRYTNADVVVVGLIGERGREVREFIERHALDVENLDI